MERVRRGLAVDPYCPICGYHSEDILHILRDCTSAKDIWNQVIPASRDEPIGCYEPSFEDQAIGNRVLFNIDDAMQLDSENVAVGGVICDENEDWIFGYNQYLGKYSIFYVELWGILEGLKLIQRRGHDKVIIQSDNLEVVKDILGSVSTALNSVFIRRI
ncbi:uncharacterized protein [Gossypium hirsutum]|uniref:RNase H type-1 domain-containing protein n=1 Tax=Gossypium hirsutum TaxID=3635 RepID=A0ABM3AZQ3_GOSHI|nr:uncharacterized protein LOC121223210 [Gossypium hirsutum]